MTFKAEMQALMSAMAIAYRAGDAHGCARLLVEDGLLYSPYAYCLRIAIANHRSAEADFDLLVAEVVRLGKAI
jgi:hypothetical protein